MYSCEKLLHLTDNRRHAARQFYICCTQFDNWDKFTHTHIHSSHKTHTHSSIPFNRTDSDIIASEDCLVVVTAQSHNKIKAHTRCSVWPTS